MYSSLVTGGAGFIGSHVSKHLLDMGHRVIILDDLSGGYEENIPSGAIFITGSITDQNTIESIFTNHKIDYVYHLAAYAAEGLSSFIKHFNYQNNLIGSINLINASVNHNIKCFVFTSSIAVYGSAQTPMSESTRPEPEDSYGISKMTVEMELKATHDMFGMDYIIFRPHNVYGEHQNIADMYRNVIGIFMNQIMQGNPMTVFGDGTQTRAFTYISDVAPLIAESVNVPGAINQIFNIGSDNVCSVNELADTLAKTMGVSKEIVYLPPRNEVLTAYSTHDKILSVFGHEATIELEEGLSKMAKWAKDMGPRSSSGYMPIEISKNLPPSWINEAE